MCRNELYMGTHASQGIFAHLAVSLIGCSNVAVVVVFTTRVIRCMIELAVFVVASAYVSLLLTYVHTYTDMHPACTCTDNHV